MKILITGATGFVGTRLVKKLESQGHRIVVTTRNPKSAVKNLGSHIEAYAWDAPHGEFPQESLSGVEAVINLMGENIAAKRWSDAQKLKLRESRIISTEKLVTALKDSDVKVFLSTSAIGYYPTNLPQKLTEQDVVGDNFLASLCEDWEKKAHEAPDSIRKLIVRVGVVLGAEGGALSKLLPLFKLGLGGPVGDGKQIMSWIHIDDLVEIYAEAITNQGFQGVANAVAPAPVSNKEFTKALAKAVRRPALFPAPPIALKLAMGELSTIVLDSQNIDCAALKQWNFTFKYPTVDKAMMQICRS